MRRFFTEEHAHGIGIFAAGNLTLASVQNWVANLGPILNLLVSAGQVAVATATVIYILKKARTLRSRRPSRKR